MNDFKNDSTARHGVRVAGLLMAMVLTACGGGGGNPGAVSGGTGSGSGSTGTGTGSTVTAEPTIAVAFSGGGMLTAGTPLTATATVLDKNGKPIADKVVTFVTDGTLATFKPTSGTVRTDVNGVATISMYAASLSAEGAGYVSVATEVDGATVTGKTAYTVGATALTFGTLSASPASIQAYGSTVLSVDVLNGSSKYTDQQVNVSFSSACVTAGKATLAATVPTNNGTVQTVYRDKGCANNDIITVTAAGIAKSASATLAIAPPAAASVQFVGATPTTQSIVVRGNGGNGRTETAILTYKVVDIFGNPLAGQRVDFTPVPAGADVVINKASDTTDATGSVVTTVNSGATPTSFRVQATLKGTGTNGGPDISTLSDSIVVTTGLPAQRGFSLSSGSFNVEGWSVDNPSATTVQVMVADAFGNPVPDGTPVVFQTNMGAIGSSDKGGCNTVNGVCSVAFRTQAPRVAIPGTPATPCNAATPDATRPGLATICASSTDGTNTVYTRTAIFMSGSAVKYVYMDASPTPLASGEIDLGTLPSSATKSFRLQFNDVNNNPMPANSTVAITGMLGGNAAPVVPATVPNVAPHTNSAVDDPTGLTVGSIPQGYTHLFSVGSTSPTNCTGPSTAKFNVTVTTPAGSVTSIPFKLSFTCP
ncbi:hypothetical protein ACEN88_09245 [Massilia sp. CT11-108]|uniref:hypothetical protein n=1 Tax=Massilia sp. CT11-108 TaxID=3393900 RepID=UPI0039A5CF1C